MKLALKTKYINGGKGFTLIELLVSAAVFSVAMVIITGIFVAAVKTQKRIIETKKILGQVSYAVEYMSRSLRMAKKDTSGTCLSVSGLNYENIFGNSGIRFINSLQDDDCQEFYLAGGQIKYLKEGQVLNLTSLDINITALKFSLSGQDQNDNLQPFVTIYLEATPKNGAPISVQTSVSQRNPDVKK